MGDSMNHKCNGCKYKGQHQEMMFSPMGVCLRETNLIEAVKNYNAEKCPYKKTNADRMRSMNDEELAEWLVYKVKCTGCNAENCDEEFCLNLMNEWIKNPCENN